MLRLAKYCPPLWASSIVNAPSTYVKLAQRPTPVQPWRLPNVPNGFEVSIKRDDLTGSALSGNKVRKLEFLLADALKKGCDTVLTCGMSTSNHCRATAVACRELGLGCYLFLRMKEGVDTSKIGSDGNLLLDRLCGTNIVAIPNVHYKSAGKKTEPDYVEGVEDKMKAMASKLEREGHKVYVIPVGGSSPLGSWGYLQAFQELLDQEIADRFDDIVLPIGSGGTAEGLGIANFLTDTHVRIHAVAVSDGAPYFREHIGANLESLKLNKQDGSRLKSDDIVQIIDGYKGLGYGVSTQDELDLLLKISTHTGVLLDPVYTTKAVNGMLSEMATDPQRFKGRRVLFIHTGGLFDNFGKLNSLVREVDATNRVKSLEEWLQGEKH